MHKRQQQGFAFGPEDDQFHTPGDQIWQTETAWFSFHVPERKLSAWLYGFVRPNIGVCTASVFVYDDSGAAPWEALFYNHQQAQPAPKERDLRDFQFPEGYRLRVLEATKRYALSFRKEDLIAVELEFSAVQDPQVYSQHAFHGAMHYDQFGHLTGKLVLLGKTIPVDCYSMRDRSWGPRPDVAPSGFNRLSYDYGYSRDGVGFCVFSSQQEMGTGGSSPIHHGYWVKNGKTVALVEGVRTVERDPARVWVTQLVIEATDAVGFKHTIHGNALSHFVWPPARWITCCNFTEWDIDGSRGYGEDQDLWQYHQWAEAHRRGRDARHQR